MAEKGAMALRGALSKLYKLLVLDRREISAIYVFAAFGGLVALSLPLGIQTIISFVMAGSVSTSIIVLIILVVAGVFVNGLLQVRQMQLTEKIQQKIFVRYSFGFADRIPKINIQKMDNYFLPELVNRFFDTMSLQKGIAKLLLDIPAAMIQMIFGLILLSFYHPVFIVFGILLFIILAIILQVTFAKGLETSLTESDYKYKAAAWFEEMARTVKTFKYSKGTSLHLTETDKITSAYLNSRTSHFKILLKQYWSLISFKLVITAAMLIVGSLLLVDQQLNIGQFVSAEIVILLTIASVEKFIVSLDNIYDVLTALEKLGKVVNSEIEKNGSAVLPPLNKGVSLELINVQFSYSDGVKVLNDFSLSVKAGEHIALLGKSGSGKTTILRMFTGAFTDFEGNILIDQVPIINYDLRSLRSQTGIMLSSQDIFHGTVRDNITMGNDNISDEEIFHLSKVTGLYGYILSLKEGFDTMLDPAGKRQPKKIVQTILLMRALLGRHRLLLLEEPDSFIDKANIPAIQNFIKTDINATIVFTTSNPEFAKVADRALHINEGKIVS
ncbi:MAG TPA: ATP-binding cassette domain-containing protein [Panacibacter sp.]|nr:ATP-binding cassette domain-containing protein [Panacibacter sp.]HNP44659.1 ATP-binding cassette domain-containing protein [Panacibacter sp.]